MILSWHKNKKKKIHENKASFMRKQKRKTVHQESTDKGAENCHIQGVYKQGLICLLYPYISRIFSTLD